MAIEEILLDIFGNEKPTDWQKLHAWRTARAVEQALADKNPRAMVRATVRLNYFDVAAEKSEMATTRIFA